MNRDERGAGGLRRLAANGLGAAAEALWRSVLLVRGNLSLALLSVALGTSLWLYVSETENPLRTEPLPFLLPVEVENLGNDVALREPVPAVQLVVTAPEDVLGRLRPEQFRVAVNLAGLRPGEDQQVPVTVRRAPEDVFISEVTPSVITVTLEERIVREVPVDVRPEGTLPPGYEYTLRLEPVVTTVQASGPASQVRAVVAARGTVRLQTVSAGEDVELRPVNSAGNIMGNVELSPATVHVRLTVTQTELTKTFGVRPQIRGQVAPGHMITRIDVDPPLVQVRGLREALESIREIATEEVDVTGATSDVVRTVRLSLPASVQPVESDTVNVRIQVVPQEGERVLYVAPETNGLRPGLRATFAQGTVEVRVRGQVSRLAALSPEDVRVSVDMGDRGPGTYRLPAQAAAPPEVQVVEVRPAELDVTLSPS
ncbi:MAG TPA: CdaR family protein [Dehalococcoidia bacterium]